MAAMSRRLSPDPARVNLMPRSEVARRERDKLTRAWVWGVLGAILIALLIVVAAFWLKWSADQRLAAEQAQTNELLTRDRVVGRSQPGAGDRVRAHGLPH